MLRCALLQEEDKLRLKEREVDDAHNEKPGCRGSTGNQAFIVCGLLPRDW